MPLPRTLQIRSIFVLAAMQIAFAQLAPWQEQYYAGMKALHEGQRQNALSLLTAAYDYARSHSVAGEWLARTAFGLGSYAQIQSDSHQAEKLHTEARSILESGAGRTPLLGLVYNALGEAILEQSRFDEAQKMFEQAAVILANDPSVKLAWLLARRHLAETRLLQEDFTGAERMLLPVVAEDSKAPATPDLSSALRVLGRIYTMQQRWEEAEKVFREAMRIESASNSTLSLADTEVAFGILYRVQGQVARAEPLLRKAIKTYESYGDARASGAYHQLGLCRLAENKLATASELFVKALDIATKASMSDGIIDRLKLDLDSARQTLSAANAAQH